jgi:hypothetical protein
MLLKGAVMHSLLIREPDDVDPIIFRMEKIDEPSSPAAKSLRPVSNQPYALTSILITLQIVHTYCQMLSQNRMLLQNTLCLLPRR